VIRAALQKLVYGGALAQEELEACAREMAEGTASPSQMAALLTAVSMRGEGTRELVAFARVLRAYRVAIAPRVESRLIDTCGTGGDGARTLNVSTLAALVAAGAGAYVAKHGNRSVTSRCGSADLLERLGFNLAASPAAMLRAIEEVGIGFLFAPTYHPAMKHVAQVRRELGFRTLFNLLGPLINPAPVEVQLVGVYSARLVPIMAEALKELGVKEAMVVHGLEGLDEISVTGKTLIAWVREGQVSIREVLPEELGARRYEALPAIEGPEHAAEVALALLRGSVGGALREVVLVNSAAALVLAGRAGGFEEGMQLATRALEQGAALEKLRALIRYSGPA